MPNLSLSTSYSKSPQPPHLSRHRTPIPSRITPRTVNPPLLLPMHSDNLSPPKRTPLPPLNNLNLMSHIVQSVRNILTNTFLQENSLVKNFARFGCSGSNADSGCVERGLGVEFESKHV